MRAATYAAGAPEAMLINTASLQMGLDYYHLPTRTMCGITHSKTLDAQAGYETMQSILLGCLSGAHIAVQCLGVLDAIMATSYEKIVLDEELISRVLCIARGIDTSEEAMAVGTIQELGPGGNYLTHPTTFKQFRNIWTPTISDWGSYDDWRQSGSEDVARMANRKFKQILSAAPETLLDADTDRQLQNYMEKARQ
jgi:trimethylamine--corrinoid protein Co-methyltransferase